MSALVTIAVVCYNQEDYIDECIASCVAQADTHPALEIVVADDGSVDRTKTIIADWAQRYPDLIRPVLADRNTGIPANFNRALAASRGTYLAWLGGDDILLPGKISAQAAHLESNPSASGSYHDAEVFEWPSNRQLGLFSEIYGGKAFVQNRVDARRMLDPAYQMLPSTVMIRRSAVTHRFDERLRFHNDYLFDFEMIARHGPYLRLDGIFTRYRKHAGSIGKDASIREKMLEENLMTLAIIGARYPRLARHVRRRQNYYIALDALKTFATGDSATGRRRAMSLVWNGAPLRGMALVAGSGIVSQLTKPEYRAVALRLRSLIS